MNLFFITGTSGSGKSTLTELLKAKLPPSHFAIYDFDENGVPDGADATWRQKTTDYWLIKAQENSKQNKSTIICGVVVPSEVLSSLKDSGVQIYFGFMKISDELIYSRLKARDWDDQLIQDNINWAHYLEKEVVSKKHHLVIDCSRNTPEKVADMFFQWVYQDNQPCVVAKKVLSIFLGQSIDDIFCKLLTGGSEEAKIVKCTHNMTSYVVKIFSTNESGKNEIAWTKLASDLGSIDI